MLLPGSDGYFMVQSLGRYPTIPLWHVDGPAANYSGTMNVTFHVMPAPASAGCNGAVWCDGYLIVCGVGVGLSLMMPGCGRMVSALSKWLGTHVHIALTHVYSLC